MLNRETLLTLFEDTAPVIVYNLDFLPDDKLDWKPAPGAKSALEIVNHLCEYLHRLHLRLNPHTDSPALLAATNRDEAKSLLSQAATQFAASVRGASTQQLGEQFHEKYPFSLGWMVTAATIDTIHHAGQIAYIQTLIGDNDIHFDQSALPAWAVN